MGSTRGDNNDNKNNTEVGPYSTAGAWAAQSFATVESIEHLIKASIAYFLEVCSLGVDLGPNDLADHFREDRFNKLMEGFEDEEALWKYISEEREENKGVKGELGLLIALGAIAEKGTCPSMLDNIVRRELAEQPAENVTVIVPRRGGIGFNMMLGVWVVMELRKIMAQCSEEYRRGSSNNDNNNNAGEGLDFRASWEKMAEAGVVERVEAKQVFKHLLYLMRHLLEFLQILINFVERRRLKPELKSGLAALRTNLFHVSFNYKQGLGGAVADAAMLVRAYSRGRPYPPMGEGMRPIMEQRHIERIEREVFHLIDPQDSKVGAENMLRSMQAAVAHPPTYELGITEDEMNELLPDGDKIPLVSAPLPEAGENYSKLLYPLKRLQIYDSRNGGQMQTAMLQPSHYIYRMLNYFRCSLLHRSNAAKFALMLRAPQYRYHELENAKMSVYDFFLNEPGPTAAEIFCVQSWLAKGFPAIHIRDDSGAWGSHNRYSDTRIIYLDQTSFDMFEDCIRHDRPTSIIFLTIFCTLAHEFAHYMISISYLGSQYLLDSVHKSMADTPKLFRVGMIADSETGLMSEAGLVLEFLLFGGSLHLLFRGDDVSERLRDLNAIWFKARGSALYEGYKLGDLAIIGPELAHQVSTIQPVPRLSVEIVKALMQEDRFITREFLEIKAKGGTEWELPLPEVWEIPDVEANFAGREIVDEKDRENIRMYRTVLQGNNGGEKMLGRRTPPMVPLPPAPRWYPRTLSSMWVLAVLAGWAYVCSLPRLNYPSAATYKEHWTVEEHYLPLFGHEALAVVGLVFVFWPIRWPLWIIGNLSLYFTEVPSLLKKRYMTRLGESSKSIYSRFWLK